MSETGHLKIVIATNDLLQVDANFASARQLVFYDVSANSSEFIDCLQFKPGAKTAGAGGKGPGGGKGCSMGDPGGGVSQEHMKDRIEAVKGCAILFSKGLSDLHAVSVKNLDVFPVKMENSREIPEVIEYVQRMIVKPPLWVRRALGYFPIEQEA
jgi:nitrogen fixation protein NifX